MIKYKVNQPLDIDAVIAVFKESGINRPVDDRPRIKQMFTSPGLIVSAWDGLELIGVSRSLTDYSFCCYLSDLAVKKPYQKQGVGKKMIELTIDAIGEKTMLLLLAAPQAMEYYPKVGFEKVDNGFILKRKN